MSGPEVRPVVEKTGARFEDAGGDQAVVMARLAARTRGAPGDGLAPERILHYFLPRAFGEIAVDDMIDDVLRVGREFRPEVVVFEAFALAGSNVSCLRPTCCRRAARLSTTVVPARPSGHRRTVYRR